MEGLLPILVPIALAFMSGGGIVAYFKYLETKPENRAKARQINITAETALAEGYAKLAADLERRMIDMEEGNKKRIAELERQIRQNEEEHRKIVSEKDQEIGRLKKRVEVLEKALEEATGRPVGTFAHEAG